VARAVFKLIIIFLCISLFIAFAFFTHLAALVFKFRKWNVLVSCVRFLCRILVKILSIEVEVCGDRSILQKKNIFFVGNHLSYLDVVVLNSLTYLIVVAKANISRWPFFGTMVSVAGTIFVERGKASRMNKYVERAVYFLDKGINILVFPEGTSTDGTRVLPIQSAFFSVPARTGSPVVPVAITYKSIDGAEINKSNKDKVYWYGDMSFVPHLFGILQLKGIKMKIEILPPLDISRMDAVDASLRRKELALLSRDSIAKALGVT